MNPDCGADIVMTLGGFRPYDGHSPAVRLPFDDKTFDELAAYDSLEHWGQQGDWRGWFDEMAEYHRILKPGGTFGVIVPLGADALTDPGHTRFFYATWFSFLSQEFYKRAMEQGASVTDYRWYWKLDFDVLHSESNSHHLSVMLRKPA